MPLYALAIFLGAFLLFQVEPILGKLLLPWFGGSPGVWATCLLFFQTLLLAGYAYAHALTRLRPRIQAIVHGIVLVAAVCFVPLLLVLPMDQPKPYWISAETEHPAWRILELLTVTIGLPYLALAATGPLIQHWFSRTHPERNPYRLYALSNAGSLLALISYPFLFEWWLPLHRQTAIWSEALVLFAAICILCAWRFSVEAAPPPPSLPLPGGGPAASSTPPTPPAPPPSLLDRASWLALPALASALLLATTNKICEDLAVVPFLWVLPLSLYLLSFILCFDSPRWYRRGPFAALAIAGVGLIAALLFLNDADVPAWTQLAGYSAALFFGCMFCHGELYRLKPPPAQLTGFYLAVAAGGALGGCLVAIVAPRIFHTFAELPLAYWGLTAALAALSFRSRSLALALGSAAGVVLVAAAIPALNGAPPLGSLLSENVPAIILLVLSAAASFAGPSREAMSRWTVRAAIFPVVLCAAAGAAFCVQAKNAGRSVVSASRNFFGVLRVLDDDRNSPQDHHFVLLHGRTVHGLQFTDPKRALLPTTYYGYSSGVGLALGSLPPDRPLRVGLVGLGTGTLTTYARPYDTYRIYDINPAVVRLARTRFTYLAHCEGRVQIVMGDARLSMLHEIADRSPQNYDLLALDAFTSDAIPVHLLTVEAFQIYLKELRPDGILAVHISNRYFDLAPVVRAAAQRLGLACVSVTDDGGSDWWEYESDWMLLSRDPRVLQRPLIKAGADLSETGHEPVGPLWTDDYASLFKVLR